MGLDNTRAFLLLEKAELSKKDKEFLKIHIETYNDFVNSLQIDILQLKDVIDFERTHK